VGDDDGGGGFALAHVGAGGGDFDLLRCFGNDGRGGRGWRGQQHAGGQYRK